MSKIRKFLKNIKSQQTVVGAIILAILLCVVTITYIINPIPLKADEATENNYENEDQSFKTQSTVDQFSYYKQINIDHDQVPSALSGFPVYINITDDSDLFSHMENNSGYDLAFFDSTNSTQFSHEIEYWDWDTGNSDVSAAIWVNVTSLASASDTIVYMYYGNATISNQEDITGVWDNNYLAVWHFAETSGTIYDSTSNNYDSTSEEGAPTYNQFGLAGRSIALDNAGDYLNFSDILDETLEADATLTYEWIMNKDPADGDSDSIFSKRALNPNNEGFKSYIVRGDHGSVPHQLYTQFTNPDNGNNNSVIKTPYLDDNVWRYIGLRFADADDILSTTYNNFSSGGIYIDANSTETLTRQDCSNSNHFHIGADRAGSNTFDGGNIDEFRVSNIKRSDNWIITFHNNIMNSSDGNFITFGSEQGSGGGEGASTYTLIGLSSPYGLTWSGTAGTSVWCNSSGDTNEFMEINMTINSTDNVTELRVFHDDLNDTSAWINASNITLWISSDNSSYASMGAFTDGGSNISINTSTWPGGGGTNPFTGAGLTDTNKSIWCVFILSIPADSPTDIFTTSTTTSCKVYIGHYT